MFSFELPLTKTRVEWKPLDMGRIIDIQAANAKTPHMNVPAMLAARVLMFGDKKSVSVGDLRALDPIDYWAYAEEVADKEEARARQLRPAPHADLVVGKLEQALISFEAAATSVREALQEAIDAARSAETSGPLGLK